MITPEARGPDQFYEGLGEADVFEVWNAVAHLYRLNPAYTDITGYSMGGFGTFDMGAQFPTCSPGPSPPWARRPTTTSSGRSAISRC